MASILPSNAKPINSPFPFKTGDPEFPPVISLFVKKFTEIGNTFNLVGDIDNAVDVFINTNTNRYSTDFMTLVLQNATYSSIVNNINKDEIINFLKNNGFTNKETKKNKKSKPRKKK